MRLMQRIAALALAGAMTATVLTGCGGGGTSNNSSNKNNGSSTSSSSSSQTESKTPTATEVKDTAATSGTVTFANSKTAAYSAKYNNATEIYMEAVLTQNSGSPMSVVYAKNESGYYNKHSGYIYANNGSKTYDINTYKKTYKISSSTVTLTGSVPEFPTSDLNATMKTGTIEIGGKTYNCETAVLRKRNSKCDYSEGIYCYEGTTLKAIIYTYNWESSQTVCFVQVTKLQNVCNLTWDDVCPEGFPDQYEDITEQ